MSYPESIILFEEEDLFQYSSSIRTQQSNFTSDYSPLQGLSYLYRGDSMNYISQFLDLIEERTPEMPSNLHQDLPSIINASHKENPRRNRFDGPEKKERKVQKNTNSPFHNYQKHLNNALKKMIVLPQLKDNDQIHKQVAHRIWNIYLLNDIKTKKILNAVFSHHNHLQINEDDLKCYGFWQIYCNYGEIIFNEAKGYLSQVAVDRIDAALIENYLMTRKLVKRQGFKEYVLGFKKELKSGSLKRRSISEPIIEN